MMIFFEIILAYAIIFHAEILRKIKNVKNGDTGKAQILIINR